jgi:hypothetical protein
VKSGYFWGVTSAVTFDPGDAGSKHAGRPRHLSLVGTVTAGGQVQITFIRGSGISESITTGFGQMVRVGDQWAFQMQMSTASGKSQLLHWANMMQTKEGDASWQKLPGVDRSVPEMLKGATYPQFGSP